MLTKSRGAQIRDLAVAVTAVIVVSLIYSRAFAVTNPTTVALTLLLVVLVAAAVSRLWVAVVTSFVAVACINFFFLPPIGRFTISDPENWVAMFGFIAVSLVASRLSAAAHDRAAIATERAQLLEERKAAEIARKSEELKSALLASLAHDLGTPLTAIRVAASNLQGSWLTDEQRHEQSEVVLTEVERLQRLFQNILEMARIEAGAIALEHRWVHPSEIVEAARGLVEFTLQGHPLDVQCDVGVLVKLDPRLTGSALAHLLENAAQYSPPESPILVKARVVDNQLEIAVHDRGPGVKESDLPHLFERFYRGETAKRASPGTGMGLSIALGFISAERGRVWAANRPDGGATFTLAVPVETRTLSTAAVTA
jgi:two-component system, OmpR family, sensor histidine kinase KdpD